MGACKTGGTALAHRFVPRALMALCAAAALVLLCLLAGCSSTGSGQTGSGNDASVGVAVQQISPEDAQNMINSQPVIIVDVRTQEEFDAEHLYNAALLTLDTIDENTASQAIPSKDSTVLVYCRTGVRSAEATQKLIDLGYTQVFDMQGGITAWPYDKCVAEHAHEGTKEFDDMPVGVKVVCGKTRALPDAEGEE